MIDRNSSKFNQYYNALVERDSSYLGVFFVGVKTTGIFCIATCRARKPLAKNVDFYTDLNTVLRDGYRPCKVCKPMHHAQEPPIDVQKSIELFHAKPTEKLSDYTLKQQGISPSKIRRWFQQHYGITFQAYQRMFRINSAYQELKEGSTSTQTAYSQGFDSLSGFAYTYKKILGKSPSQYTQPPILLQRFTSPIGPMFVAATDVGVCLLEFVDRRMLETEFKELQQKLKAPIIVGENVHTSQAQKELEEYFEGKRQKFTFALHTPGTPFQKLVWQQLQQIPYGHTRSYQQQAEKIGKPTAVRAVASANGHNRVAIVIPCHRVIGKDGSLTGYGGGLERKKWLLDLEAKFIQNVGA